MVLVVGVPHCCVQFALLAVDPINNMMGLKSRLRFGIMHVVIVNLVVADYQYRITVQVYPIGASS